MKLSTLFLLFLCSLLHRRADTKTIGTRIIGGSDARVGQFPWQAAVYVDTANGKYFCGGSLITHQWILTAAHCLYNARVFTIHLGSIRLQSADSDRFIASTSTYEMFPNFDPETLEHDIGLIKLHMPVTLNDYIQPIALAPLGETAEGTVAIATGWGQVGDSEAGLIDNLQYVRVAVISNAECRLTYGDQIKSTMICTMGNYNEGICTGDTGGALIVEKGLNDYMQIGVSGFFSQQGCESLHPSGYIRTDVYNEWINNITAEA